MTSSNLLFPGSVGVGGTAFRTGRIATGTNAASLGPHAADVPRRAQGNGGIRPAISWDERYIYLHQWLVSNVFHFHPYLAY